MSANPLRSQVFHKSKLVISGKDDRPGTRSARLPDVRFPSRSTAIVAALLAALLSLLLAAPLALAENGVGLAGPTTDKTVTFFCFGVIGFFAILVVVLTIVQERLERRKEARKYDLQRYG